MAVSTVYLDNIQLDIDPEQYIPLGGRRRGSIHRLIDGGTVYQDRGINETDLSIMLSGKFTDLTTLKAIYAIYRKKGYEFVLKDFKDCEFLVVFTPGVESFRAAPLYGSNRGWSYQIMLSVVSVQKWFSTSSGFPSDT
jgi:hypothetical protein